MDKCAAYERLYKFQKPLVETARWGVSVIFRIGFQDQTVVRFDPSACIALISLSNTRS